jgi:hypothetical protein
MMMTANPNVSRRRVPRRYFDSPVGILVKGEYTINRAYQVGEGGMMVDLKSKTLKEGDRMAASFYLPGGKLILVRGIVRAVVPAKDGKPQRYGIEFVELDFHFKREIRNFVAAATRADGQLVA